MLDRSSLRERPEAVAEAIANRGADVDLEAILELDEQWRDRKARGDSLR
ncbi:serine--tRNA ligase, partial [Saliphagus infecundisoli]